MDLIRDNYDWLMGENVQLLFLGSGTADLEESLRDMENRCGKGYGARFTTNGINMSTGVACGGFKG